MKLKTAVLVLLSVFMFALSRAQDKPLEMGVIGLSHAHVQWVFNSEKQGAITIVGIVEPNQDLVLRYAKQFGTAKSIFYDTIEDMLAVVKPEAVSAFGTIYQHLEIVEKVAPLGIHVMVEKPLAVSLDHAKKMEALAKKYKIHLLTNYETSWYATNHKAYEFVNNDSIGSIRKVVIRDGHKGPKKIGVNKEFLDWLTDPVLNGGGAITDFGCYGANLMTWLMKGEKPSAVTAVTQQLQAENNPLVDDDATIILKYGTANATIQASWDWPIGRKDMEIYGLKGVIYADNPNDLRVRIADGYSGFTETAHKFGALEAPFDDPFSLFAAVIKNKITLKPFGLYTLENNMIVMEILDAAIKSSKSDKTITMD